jgi:hypothetical protein
MVHTSLREKTRLKSKASQPNQKGTPEHRVEICYGESKAECHETSAPENKTAPLIKKQDNTTGRTGVCQNETPNENAKRG